MPIQQEQLKDINDIKEQTGYLIYSRDVVHRYSPAIGKLLDLFMDHLEDAFEAKRNGKEVVWVDFLHPTFIYACGAIPISIPDMARLGSMETMKQAEEFFQIPAETCSMVKSKIGGFYKYKDAPVKKAVFGSFACEPQFGVTALMESYGYDTFVFDIIRKPANATEEQTALAKKRYRRELEKAAKWINGKGVDLDILQKEMARNNRIHSKTDRLQELQKLHPTYMRSLPSMLLISAREGYYGQPERYEEILEELIAEFEALPSGSYCGKVVNLAWSGARGVDFSVFNAIDALGGCITGWNIAGSGEKRYKENKDPLEAYIDYAMGGRSTISMKEKRKQDEALFLKSNAAGIILYLTQGCTHQTIAREISRRYLSEKGIPTLALNGTAQIGEATGQVMTRVKAFIEMLS